MEFLFMLTDDSASLRNALQALFGTELVIDRELGRGGMAAVFLALDPGLQRRVAVKVLLPALNQHRVGDRFLREARMMAALRHPNIVTVHAVRSSSETHAFVMQFVDGINLETRLEQGLVPIDEAGKILAQVSAALQYAHEQGVVHRDVKPANVLLDARGNAVVSDFGIARSHDFESLTSTGIVVGSWDYMSPEQRAGEAVTAATDQYAFGVLAFEVLAGRLPFVGAPLEVMRGHMQDEPPAIRSLRPDVPHAIDALVRRMLAKDPEARFPDLLEASTVFAELSRRNSRAPASTGRTRSESAPNGSKRRQAAIAVVTVAALSPVVWVAAGRLGGDDAVPPPPAMESRDTALAERSRADSITSSRADNALRSQPQAVRSRVASRSATTLAEPLSNDTSTVQQTDTNTAETREAELPGNVRTAPDSARGVAGSSPPPPPVVNAPAPTIADARRLAREFVTMVNQRRARDLERLPASTSTGGQSRTELIRLVQSAPDLAAGFERLASAPIPDDNRFETEFDLDLQWRGGRTIMRITLTASHSSGAWSMASYSARTP
jgi:serine/threonine protein kinase